MTPGAAPDELLTVAQIEQALGGRVAVTRDVPWHQDGIAGTWVRGWIVSHPEKGCEHALVVTNRVSGPSFDLRAPAGRADQAGAQERLVACARVLMRTLNHLMCRELPSVFVRLADVIQSLRGLASACTARDAAAVCGFQLVRKSASRQRRAPESFDRTGTETLRSTPMAQDDNGEHGDELPEDLQPSLAYVGPYVFPDIRRRRIAGALYALVGAAACWVGAASGNGGLLFGGALLLAVAAYHFAASWPLHVDQTEALAVASRTVGFPVGHASAQLGWRGLRSRPAWRILLYSADEPPSIRGLVELDAVTGRVLGEYTEQNPEDWSQFR